MKKLSQRLPKKMSSLLLLALKDLERTEKDPRYEIDMGNWHKPPLGLGRCSVCLAGAVLAQRQFLSIKKDWRFARDTGRTNNALRLKMLAINFLRCGFVSSAASKLGLPYTGHAARLNRPVTPYDRNRAQFKKELHDLIFDLKEVGL